MDSDCMLCLSIGIWDDSRADYEDSFISRQITHLLGGVIDVESVKGMGSTFSFTSASIHL